jgi:hypothetical protein
MMREFLVRAGIFHPDRHRHTALFIASIAGWRLTDYLFWAVLSIILGLFRAGANRLLLRSGWPIAHHEDWNGERDDGSKLTSPGGMPTSHGTRYAAGPPT